MKTIASVSVCFIVVVVLTVLSLNSSYAVDLQDPSVVGAWLFNEGSGTTAKDSSQYHNDGEITDGEWVDGVFDKALKFDGTAASVGIPHSESLDFSGKKEISISCWINIMGDDTNWGRIVDKSPVNNSYTMTKVEGQNTVLWRPITTTGRVDIISSPIEQNTWYHIVGVYDGTEARFYLNSNLDQTTEGTGELGEANDALVIGGDAPVGGRSRFNGMIDEVVILNRVLTEAEIKELMEGGVTTVEPAGKLTTMWGSIKSQD